MDGRYFTENAQEWVDKLIAEVDSRQKYNNARIARMKSRLAVGDMSEKEEKRLNRRIGQLKERNAQLESVKGEVETLKESNQAYDVKISNEYSSAGPTPGSGTDVGAAEFNYNNGNFVMTLPSSAGLSLFSHELKHAYQFETGAYSIGPIMPNEDIYTNFLYDKYDEVEAYDRGALFGGTTYTVNSLPAEYNFIATGPVDATTQPNIRAILGMSSDVQKKAFQHIANVTNQTFRINGVTYYNKSK